MSIKGRTVKAAVTAMAQTGLVEPLIRLYSYAIDEETGKDGPYTLLALTPWRFRGDLEVLASTGRFRVLKLPVIWQTRLLSMFWPTDGKPELGAYCRPDPDSPLAAARREIRSILRSFWPELLERLEVDAVLGSAIHYVQDMDWGAVARECGVPYIVLHRENLLTSPGHFRGQLEINSRIGRFEGTHVIVHNEPARRTMIESGVVEPDEVTALGALRMDTWVDRVAKADPAPAEAPQVTLFSFTRGDGYLGQVPLWDTDSKKALETLFEEVHVAVAELARDHPHIEFVIKPKWGDTWYDEIDRALTSNGLDPGDIPNLVVDADRDSQQMILDSNVVIGYGSTVLLEAAIAGRPVIFPDFAETKDPENREWVHFKDELHIFDVAESKDDLKERILDRLEDPTVEEKVMQERRRIFEKYVSSLDGHATTRYTEKIVEVLEDSSRSEDHMPAGS